MANKLKYTVELEDETVLEVQADQRDIAKAEGQLGTDFDVMSTVTGSRCIAYFALHRTKQLPSTIKTWAEFNRQCVEASFDLVDLKAGNKDQPEES